jgi:hypothetical protein
MYNVVSQQYFSSSLTCSHVFYSFSAISIFLPSNTWAEASDYNQIVGFQQLEAGESK